MPKIPIYGEPQVNLGGRPRQGLSDRDIQTLGYQEGGQIAEAGREIGRLADKAMGFEIQRQREDAAIEFEQKRAKFEVALDEGDSKFRMEDSANVNKYANADYGGEASKDENTYYNRTTKHFKNLANSEEFKSNNQFFRQYWEKYTAAKEADIRISARKFEAAQRVQARENSIDDSLTNDAKLAVANPDKIPDILQRWKNVLGGFGKDENGQPIPNYAGVVRGTFLRDRLEKLGQILVIPALEKMIIDDPKSAMQLLTSVGKELGGENFSLSDIAQGKIPGAKAAGPAGPIELTPDAAVKYGQELEALIRDLDSDQNPQRTKQAPEIARLKGQLKEITAYLNENPPDGPGVVRTKVTDSPLRTEPQKPEANIEGNTLRSVDAALEGELAAVPEVGDPGFEESLAAQKKRIDGFEELKQALLKKQAKLDAEYAKDLKAWKAKQEAGPAQDGEVKPLVLAPPPQQPGKLSPEKSLMARWGLEPADWVRLYSKARANMDTVNAYDEYRLKESVADHIASVGSGNPGDPRFKTKEGLANAVSQLYSGVYGADAPKYTQKAQIFVDEAWSKIRIAERAWQVGSSLKWADDQTLDKAVAGLSPQGKGAADTAEVRDRVIAIVNSYRAQRSADPVGYANSHPQVQKLARDGDVAGARTMSIAIQQKFGAQDWQVGVLSKQEASAEVNRFRNAQPGQVISMIRDFETRFGGRNQDGSIKYPGQLQAAWRQLTTGQDGLDSSWQFAARSMGTNAESKIYNALKADPKTLRDQVGTLQKTGTSYADIESQALLEGAAFKKALTGNMPERIEMWQGAYTLAVKMAAMDVYSNGTPTSKALKSAFSSLSQSFDMSGGTYVVPQPRPGYPTAYVNKNIHANAEYLKTPEALGRLFQIVPPASRDGALNNQTGYRQDSYLKTLGSESYWITNNNSSGLILVHNAKTGVEPVLQKDGSIIDIKFSDLSKDPSVWKPLSREPTEKGQNNFFRDPLSIPMAE